VGTFPFRFDCAAQNLSVMITPNGSTRFQEFQGPVCVDGLVPRCSYSRCGNGANVAFDIRPSSCWNCRISIMATANGTRPYRW
jgi:hypothetical protein